MLRELVDPMDRLYQRQGSYYTEKNKYKITKLEKNKKKHQDRDVELVTFACSAQHDRELNLGKFIKLLGDIDPLVLVLGAEKSVQSLEAHHYHHSHLVLRDMFIHFSLVFTKVSHVRCLEIV